MRLAVFASGNGSNFSAIQEAILSKELSADIACVICDQKDAGIYQRAKDAGIPIYYFDIKTFSSKKEYEKAIIAPLDKEMVELIILAGYMRIVGSTLLEAFPKRILNIHPSYLPAFPGKQGIRDAFEAGVDQTGVTIHIVDEGVDSGPILAQEKLPILSTDSLATLEAKIHGIEHRLYSKTIQDYINQLKTRRTYDTSIN